MEGWRRVDEWAATGLDWTPPSPSLWRPEAARTYPGLCFFEGTNLSIGGSTYRPYEVIGAPWLDADGIARTCNSLELPGVTFTPTQYAPIKPNDGKFDGQLCRAIQLDVTDPMRFDPVVAGLTLLRAVAARHPSELTLRRDHLRLLLGSDTLLDQMLTASDLTPLQTRWANDCARFRKLREPYLLYRP